MTASKLTPQQWDLVRAEYVPGVTRQADLAKKWGVSKAALWRALTMASLIAKHVTSLEDL